MMAYALILSASPEELSCIKRKREFELIMHGICDVRGWNHTILDFDANAELKSLQDKKEESDIGLID